MSRRFDAGTGYIYINFNRAALANDIGYSFSICSNTTFALLGDKIPQSRLEVVNGRYQVTICLSSLEYVPEPVVASKSDVSSSAALFLERLYHDVHDRDVTFIFNNPDLAITDEITFEKAHKLVLNQWSYFNRMFKSDFMEGGAGEKEIQIKDVKPKVFKLLLRFMYTGTIPHAEQPLATFTDTVTNPQDVSWEDLFLTAHRYEVNELCDHIEKLILEKLTPQTAIPFLFRTGYLFDALRAPSIKYIASTSASQVASKSFRDAYQDHPEFGGLLFELFEASNGCK
ncbi:hypothetical protein BG000_001868 [Podila horticola]|nr:hypothetical protein BG000_001868 [Podila horticola]